jgi:hypothetical protein
MGRDDKNKYTMNVAKMNTFISELRTLLGNKYTVEFNTNADTHGGARIIIDSKYTDCRCFTCECRYGCNVSDEFENLVEKYNFRYAFHRDSLIGLWRK